MAAASIESAFVLIDRASGPTRRIRREVRGLRLEAEAAGRALDDMAGPKVARELDAFADDVRGVRTEAKGAGRDLAVLERGLRGVTREVDRGRVATDRLVASLRTLGAVDARPRVHLDGISESRAELAAFRAELRLLGRQQATAVAGISGGGFGGVGARSAGYAGIPGGVGVVTTRVGVLAGGAALALPAVQALTGATGALAASLTGAGLGAGAVGVAGGGALAAGVGALASVVIPAKKAVEDASKAQEQLNAQVAAFGANSRQAAAARREFDRVLAAGPAGTMNFLRQRSAFGRDWRRATAGAQTDLLGLASGAMGRVRSRSGRLGAAAGTVAGAARGEGLELVDFLTGPRSLRTIDVLTESFADNLDEAEGTAENLLRTMGNVAEASMPFFDRGMEWLEEWTGGWRDGTRDIDETRRTIGGFIDDLEAWGRLGGAGFDLVRELIGPARPAGRSLLDDATGQLREWESWADRNPARLEAFFDDTADSAKDLAGAIRDAVGWLDELATDLQPLLDRFTDLVSVASELGVIGAPGAAAFLLGGYRGMRGGGRGGASPDGASALLAGAVGGGALAGGRAASAPGRGLAFSRVYGGVAGARYGAPVSMLGSRTSGVGRGAQRFGAGLRAGARVALPVTAGLAALDALAFDGSGWERAQAGLSGASLGLIPAPVTGDEALDRAGGSLNRFLWMPRSDDELGGELASMEQGLALFRHTGPTGLLGTSNELQWGGREFSGESGMRELEEYVRLLGEERDARRDANREMERASRRRKDERARQGALEFGLSLGDTFGAYRRGGMAPQDAAGRTTEQAKRRLGSIRDAGVETLGEASLDWARALAREDPAMRSQVDELTAAIERRFRRMGRNVAIVNGDILTGSRREWREIAAALIDPVERARQEVTAGFTDIQRKAIGALTAMGFSPQQARGLVRNAEAGSRSARRALRNPAAAAASGRVGGRVGPSAIDLASAPQGDGLGWGDGLGNAGMGGTAARFQQMRAAGGGLLGADADLAPYATLGASMGLQVSSGLRAGAVTSSGNPSYHGTGDALDVSGPADSMLHFAQTIAGRYGGGLEELIYTPLGFSIKNGRRVPPYAQADHYDHVHIADVDVAAGAGMAFSPDTLGPGLQRLLLSAPGSQLGGFPGALSSAATGMYAAGLEQRLNETLGAGGLPGGGDWASMVAGVGLPPIFNAIIGAESSGDPNALNPSGATGLTQVMTPLHNALIQRVAGALGLPADPRIPAVNLGVAKALYDESGLAPWAESRPVWGGAMGDGSGWARPRLSMGGGRLALAGTASGGRGPGGGVSINPSFTINPRAPHDERQVVAVVERELVRFAAAVERELSSDGADAM